MLDDFSDTESALREYAVKVAEDRDACRARGDVEFAEALHNRWLHIHELADRWRDSRPEAVPAPEWTLHEARALVDQLRARLAAMVPNNAARRVAARSFVAPTTLDAMVDRVVAYLRVSTSRQAADGYGLDVQEAAVQMWARRNRVKIAYVIRDEGWTGADVDRPGLAEALGHIEAKRATAVVVPRLDRLARSLILQEWIRAELLSAGAQLRSADPVEDRTLIEQPDDPTANLVRQILGAVAEHERAMIRLRMNAGKAKKREAGGYVAGQPPYGYRADGHDLVPNLAEQRQVQRMKRWRRDGLSFRQIADRLNTEGVPARGGGKWHPPTVQRVVERPARRKAS